MIVMLRRFYSFYRKTVSLGFIITGFMLLSTLNADLMSQERMEPVGSYSMGDILGAEVQGDRLYYGDGGIFRIADISDPSNPQELGYLSTLGSIRRIIVDDDIAFVSYRGEKGFSTVDVSDPTDIRVLANNYTQLPDTYVLSGNNFFMGRSGYVSLFDVSDPANPDVTDNQSFSTEGDAIAVSGNYAYITGRRSTINNNTYLITTDVSDPSDMQITDSLVVPTENNIQEAIADNGYVYLIDEQAKVMSVDISTPDQPEIEAEVSFSNYPISSVEVMKTKGDSLFIKLSSGNLGLIDISDPTNIYVMWVKSLESGSGYGELDVQGKYLYNATETFGLDIYDISASESDLVPQVNLASPFLNDIVVYGSLAVATSFPKNGRVQTLSVMDISNPELPTMQETFSIGENGLSNMELANGWAYFYNVDSGGVDALDLSNPDQPVYQQDFLSTLRPRASSGNYLITDYSNPDGDQALKIWNVSTPSQPSQDALIYTRRPEKVTVSGDSMYTYVDYFDSDTNEEVIGVRIYDLSDISSVQQVGFVDLSDHEFLSSWEVSNDYLFLIDEPLLVLDISDPANPTEVASLEVNLLREAENTKLNGNRLYVPVSRPYRFNTVASPYPADILEGLWEIDISDPSSPQIAGVYGNFDAVHEPSVQNDLIVMRTFAGISITRSAQTNVSTSPPSEIPEQVSLKPNYPNPFNPATQISYSLPEAQNIKLTVYNVLGKEVATLVDGNRNAGDHTVTFRAENLSSGVYLYRLEAQNVSKSKKMLLIK